MAIAKEGAGIIVVFGLFAVLSVILAAIWWTNTYSITISLFIVFIFFGTVYFFRDPDRRIPENPSVVVSPADGVIMEVKSIPEDEFIGGPATEVSIFLSIFDVHVNRIPISGIIEFVQYREGTFHAAFSEKAGCNEQNCIGIVKNQLRICVRQIAGMIARRIVCTVKPGTVVRKGDRFGMIKFGSRTDIVLPARVNITVKPKQHVRGGETIIGTYENDE